MRRTRHECVMDCTGGDIFIVFDGMKIAKRGYPDAAGNDVGVA